MAKIQKLPKWFKGETYKKGDIVHNQFSGESYELNNIELSMYDFSHYFFICLFIQSPI